jgi:hypothetical protein
MQITRRNFIQTAGVAAALVVSGRAFTAHGQGLTTDLFPLPAEVYSEPLFSFTATQFEALVGTNFAVTLSGGRTAMLALTEVTRLERPKNTLGGYYGECFSLILESAQRLKLRQGTFQVSGGGLDLGSVLIVPTGRDQKQYEILVNHITR